MIARAFLVLCLTAAAFAQTAEPRVLHVSVSLAANHKLVTGLDQRNFAVVESGVVRPVTGLEHDNSVTVAVVGADDATYALLTRRVPVLRAASLEDAVSQLSSAVGRKALIVPSGTNTTTVPGGIHIVEAADDFQRAQLIALHSYSLRYTPNDPAAPLQVVLAGVEGLPSLTVDWK